MTHYGLIIIGSGTGNSLITEDFATTDVAVIEKGTFGGTCLNVGCIPTKMFVHAADVAADTREAGRLGVDAHVDQVRWADIRDRVFGRIDPISAGGRDYRAQGEHTALIEGVARFVGPRELLVGEERLTGDQVVIATGSTPVVPEVFDGIEVHTSDTVMRLEELPATMAVVGGGVIAAEMAHVFAGLGVKVTLIHRGPRLLRVLDEEVGEAFTELARGQWDVRLNRTVAAAREEDGVTLLTLDDGSSVEAGVVLVATGRRPQTDQLDCAAGGVDLRDDGKVQVDEFGRTSAPGVWALGDVSNTFELKHVANAEGRALAHNLAHPDDLRAYPHGVVPAGVFTRPQIATVGMTEQQAREAGLDITCAVQRFGDTAYGWALEDTSSFVKLIADRATRRLVGAHILGPEATILIQPLIQAMAAGVDAGRLARQQYWIHPALTEVVENALLALDLP